MWDCPFVGLFIWLACPRLADGLSERDTIGSASARDLARDLNEQWEDIFADLHQRNDTHEHHCWPHAYQGRQPVAATSDDDTIEASAPSGFKFNLTEADLVAELQTTVYCDRARVEAWNCSRCQGGAASFELHRLVFIEEWDLTAMIGRWPLLDAAVVTFRGTDSHNLGNWIADMDMRMTEYPVGHGAPPARLPSQESLAGGPKGSLADVLSGSDAAPGAATVDGGRDVDEDTPRVHSGFLRSLVESALYQGVYDALSTLRAELGHAPRRLYITGHSLGGAMAALAAPMIVRDFAPEDIRLITFGCPRTGNQAFVDLLMASVDVSIRFTHSHDIVPSLPPPFFGFQHFPREIWQIDLTCRGQSENGQNVSMPQGHLESFILHPSMPEQDSAAESLHFMCKHEGIADNQDFEFRICDGSGEDPDCHDSLCYWAPCRSLEDHIFYLGKHMYHREGEC